MSSAAALPLTLLLCLLPGGRVLAAADRDDISGGELNFAQRCLSCHARPAGRIPGIGALRQRSPEQLVQAMHSGTMHAQASGLRVFQMQGIAWFLNRAHAGRAHRGRRRAQSLRARAPFSARCQSHAYPAGARQR